jgi:hypothetical protein
MEIKISSTRHETQEIEFLIILLFVNVQKQILFEYHVLFIEKRIIC